MAFCAGTVCACSGMSALEVHQHPLPAPWRERSQGPVDSEQKLTGERNSSIIRNKLFQPADIGNRSRGNEEFRVDGEAVFHWNLNCKAHAILVQNWCPNVIGVWNYCIGVGLKFLFCPPKRILDFTTLHEK